MDRNIEQNEVFRKLARGEEAVWLRNTVSDASSLSPDFTTTMVDAAAARFERFAPVLAALFPESGWDGKVRSDLLDFCGGALGRGGFIKADHTLPMTGSIKARGGVHELLCYVEDIAEDADFPFGNNYIDLNSNHARAEFAKHRVVVASTGNLGFSIGLVARRFGLQAEIHMSLDAKQWKKARLRQLGATVVEHPVDFSETVARARVAAAAMDRTLFVDDEKSVRLFAGYAVAARELIGQFSDRIVPTRERPLIVYLPCGVGGSPGGISFGLKSLLGERVICVFVEPVASACVLTALASGQLRPAPRVYDFGGSNDTIADGLAVPRASELALNIVGQAIDAAIAVTDAQMLIALRDAWDSDGLRLEPSASAAIAAMVPLLAAAPKDWPSLNDAYHIFWATGGSRLPDAEFSQLLVAAGRLKNDEHADL